MSFIPQGSSRVVEMMQATSMLLPSCSMLCGSRLGSSCSFYCDRFHKFCAVVSFIVTAAGWLHDSRILHDVDVEWVQVWSHAHPGDFIDLDQRIIRVHLYPLSTSCTPEPYRSGVWETCTGQGLTAHLIYSQWVTGEHTIDGIVEAWRPSLNWRRLYFLRILVPNHQLLLVIEHAFKSLTKYCAAAYLVITELALFCLVR